MLLLCIAICSCEGDTIDSNKLGKPLQLKAEINGLTTRASNSSWDKDDAIGIYMLKSGQTLNSSALKKNAQYVTSGSSSFEPTDETDQIIFPFNGSSVDLIGYYPYRKEITNFSYDVDLSNQSVQADIDLLYSTNAKGVSSGNPNVNMLFTHQLSKIVLNINHGTAFNLNDLSVIISNTATKASFDLVTGTLSSASALGDVELKINIAESIVEAILLPTNNLSGMHLWFIIGEEFEVYKLSLSEALNINAFQKSTKYTYNVTLFGNESVMITGGNITDWTTGLTENMTADRTEENPPLIKGSQRAPYTVAEVKNNQGKTGVWVEGFIVGSFDGSINKFLPSADGAKQNNIALADTPGETDTGKMIPVNLPSTGSIKAALNIPDNPDNIGKKVLLKGNLNAYYSVPALRDVKGYQFK